MHPELKLSSQSPEIAATSWTAVAWSKMSALTMHFELSIQAALTLEFVMLTLSFGVNVKSS